MDPQKLSQLDPKLREAYQRVMGTTIPDPQAQTPLPDEASAKAGSPISDPTSTPQPQSPSTPAPKSFFIPQPETNPQPQAPLAGGPAPEPTIPAQPIPTQNFTAPPPMPQTQTMAVKKKSGITPVLFGIVGLIFLVIYTLFWTKIFNLKLPFLP